MDAIAPSSPRISVIIPVRNAPETLAQCLEALSHSTYTDFEVIVVDDASETLAEVEFPRLRVEWLRLAHQSGPAAARNRGAAAARGEILLFVDADVCVTPRTLEQVATALAEDPTIDAIFGSYDQFPAASNILSQYKNLFHHFVHQQGRREAKTFWAGCGAIRRRVFEEVGGFSTAYGRPCIEDIELGSRLVRAGRRIVLDKSIQARHLKRWSLWSVIKSDVLDRGVPWTELMLREGWMPDDLNVSKTQRVCAVLAYALVILMMLGAWYWHGMLLLPFLTLLAILMLDYISERRPLPTAFLALAVLFNLGVVAAIALQFRMWTLLGLSFVLGIVLLNLRFYVFFASERHPLFAAVILPLHVLYYIYSGIAFTAGLWMHLWRIHVARRIR